MTTDTIKALADSDAKQEVLWDVRRLAERCGIPDGEPKSDIAWLADFVAALTQQVADLNAQLAATKGLFAAALAECDALRTRLDFAETARSDLRGWLDRAQARLEEEQAGAKFLADELAKCRALIAGMNAEIAEREARVDSTTVSPDAPVLRFRFVSDGEHVGHSAKDCETCRQDAQNSTTIYRRTRDERDRALADLSECQSACIELQSEVDAVSKDRFLSSRLAEEARESLRLAHLANASALKDIAALRRRIRIAKRALRKSTKYEPWDDFEWTASIALDLRRTDYTKPTKRKAATR